MSTGIFLSLLLLGYQTIVATEAAQQNWNATVSANIDGPTVNQVWPYVADFCNLYKIFPSDVSFCVQGSDGQPGQIRYSSGKYPSPSEANATVVLWAREELLAFDATKKYVTYQIHENNRGLNLFIGTMQVLLNVDDINSDFATDCIFKWSVVASPVVGVTYQGFVDSLNVGVGEIVALIESLF